MCFISKKERYKEHRPKVRGSGEGGGIRAEMQEIRGSHSKQQYSTWEGSRQGDCQSPEGAVKDC